MNSGHNTVLNTLLAIEWILLVTVMVGGEALLRLSQGELSEHTERYFRAGHAHAGVLVGIGMVLVLSLGRTDLSGQGMVITWIGWVGSVLLLSGGLFYHAYLGESGESSPGTWMTAIGGIGLAIVASWLALQLLRAR